MKVFIDYETALRLVNGEVAKEGPDYVYGTPGRIACLNVEEDGDGNLVGSCLVGRALIAAGVYPQELANYRDSDIMTVHEASGLIKLTDKAKYFLARVQTAQDGSHPWGKAVELGVRYVNTDNSFTVYDDVEYR